MVAQFSREELIGTSSTAWPATTRIDSRIPGPTCHPKVPLPEYKIQNRVSAGDLLWPSITPWVITRARAAFAIKAKANFECHRIPQLSSTWTVVSIQCVGDQFAECTRRGNFPHGDERTKAVHRYRPLIFNSVAAVNMLLFAFLKQVGPRGDTNSHDHPHFWLIGGHVEVRARDCKNEELLSPYRRWVVNLLDVQADRTGRSFRDSHDQSFLAASAQSSPIFRVHRQSLHRSYRRNADERTVITDRPVFRQTGKRGKHDCPTSD